MKSLSFAILCFLGAILCTLLTTILVMFSGWGDGSGGNAIQGADRIIAYIPCSCLFLLFLACFRGIPLLVIRGMLLTATAMFMIFFIPWFLHGGSMALVFSIPLIAYGIAAYWILWPQPKIDS